MKNNSTWIVLTVVIFVAASLQQQPVSVVFLSILDNLTFEATHFLQSLYALAHENFLADPRNFVKTPQKYVNCCSVN